MIPAVDSNTLAESLPLITRWKRFLSEQRLLIKQNYFNTPSASALLRQHRKLVDKVLQAVWRENGIPRSCALLAVGGYGRGELFPYSDIDLLILVDREIDVTLQTKLEELIGTLWDIGLEVGHSVRNVEECHQLASHDITVQTNLLEARLLCGSRNLFNQFTRVMHLSLDPKGFCKAKQLEQQLRYTRYHDTTYNLEPNLKENPGGLRDLQNILWIARAGNIGTTWDDLVKHGITTTQEARQIKRQETFLNNLRIRLHYLAARREDRLLFDFQTALANQMGFSDKPTRRASEQLMQDFYRTTKTVRQLNTIVLQNLRARIFPLTTGEPEIINERFLIRNELLEARDPDLFHKEPSAILESFLLLQQHHQLKGMKAATLRALWRARREINKTFRNDPKNKKLFMQILQQPSAVTRELRRMNQYGILGLYIPAFGRIVGQMQHDLYHVYSVDEHILMVLRNLRRFTIAETAHEYPLCSRLINDFTQPELLYLAALFHDIAKGRGGDHSTLGAVDARRFCKLHDLNKEDIELVVWLVENHLVMSATAQKQDLSDPEVIQTFARFVGDERHLVALYLLTVADIRGTSPKVWNAWKGKLLEDLFWLTRHHLSGNQVSAESNLQKRQEEALRELRFNAIDDAAIQKLWQTLDTSYFLRHDAQEIAWHARYLNYRVNTDKPIVKARLSPLGEGLQVMIYVADQKDLFARICGFFERISYNIVEAKIYTTQNGYALDTFQVIDPFQKAPAYRDLISFIEHELSERLSKQTPLEPPSNGRLSRHLKHFPITPEVSIRPDEKGAYHILFVIAGDRPGLLLRVAYTLVKYKIDVHTAKINTLGERAEDVFLISGETLDDPKAIVQLESDLIQQLQT